jgi:hypothetical protein
VKSGTVHGVVGGRETSRSAVATVVVPIGGGGGSLNPRA